MIDKENAKIKWTFDEIGLITQSPDIIRESFRIRELSEVLVREVIQNSLDARLLGSKLQMVFSFNNIKKETIAEYFESLIPHLEAKRYGKEGSILSKEVTDAVRSSVQVNTLCIEDLGTTGLIGDINKIRADNGVGSDFWSFWWAEGLSNKHGTKGGRWGQGKTTLNMASKLSSFWGLTRRHSDFQEILMGKSLLNPHSIDGKLYMHHGLYLNSDTSPISSGKYLKDFKSKFEILRGSTESGLSIIIPYPVEELSFDSIVKASLIHYFFPIIKKDLTIKIKDTDGKIHDISENTIIELAHSLDWSNTEWDKPKKEDNLELLRFSQECTKAMSNDSLIDIPKSVAISSKISEELMQESLNLGELKLKFNSGTLLGFNVPVIITKKDGREVHSFFNVFVKKYLDGTMKKSDEHYYRSGLSLPEEPRRMGGRPVRGLFNAEDDPISEFLGLLRIPE